MFEKPKQDFICIGDVIQLNTRQLIGIYEFMFSSYLFMETVIVN